MTFILRLTALRLHSALSTHPSRTAIHHASFHSSRFLVVLTNRHLHQYSGIDSTVQKRRVTRIYTQTRCFFSVVQEGAWRRTPQIECGTSSIHFHQGSTRSSITISNPTTSTSTEHSPSSFHAQCLESNPIPYTLRHTLRSTIRRAQSMNSDPAKHVDPARTIGPVYDPCALDSNAPAAGPPRSALSTCTHRTAGECKSV